MSVFDKYADNYDDGHKQAVKASGFEPDYFHEYKVKIVAEYLKKLKLSDQKLKILNFGCGTGNSEKLLRKYLQDINIYSCDISSESIKTAIKSNANLSNVRFATFNGINIPFEEEFDIIFVAMVSHHIPRQLHLKVMKNIFLKLKTNGFLFIFELNPINPLTMWVVRNNDYKFDKKANALNPYYEKKLLKNAGFTKNETKFAIFFPKFLSFLIPFEKFLKKLPIGAHYYSISTK